jgi:hypothetical protein
VFKVPGQARLPIGKSKWYDPERCDGEDTWVRVPEFYWQATIEIARDIDRQRAAALVNAGYCDDVVPSPDRIRELIVLLQAIRAKVRARDSLVERLQGQIKDRTEGWYWKASEWEQMIDAILGVFSESLHLSKPWEAWVEGGRGSDPDSYYLSDYYLEDSD